MNKYLIWFRLLCKRVIKKPTFLIILILIPIVTFMLKFSLERTSIDIHVGIIALSDDETSQTFLTKVLEYNSRFVHFHKYTSKDELEQAVKSQTIQCGYVLHEDFSSKLSDGNYSKLMTVYQPTNSIIVSITDELMTSFLSDKLALGIVTDICFSDKMLGYVNEDKLEESINEHFYYYASNTDSFSFHFTNVISDESYDIDYAKSVVTPLRGVIALFIFISAMAGGVTWYNDRKNGAFKICTRGFSIYTGFLEIFIPTLLTSIVSLINIYFLNISSNFIIEILTILLYTLICTAFTLLICSIIRSALRFTSCIPIFIIGSLIFSPIIINIAAFAPSLTFAKYLFMPTYYLMMFM